jgi:hypothetical protein
MAWMKALCRGPRASRLMRYLGSFSSRNISVQRFERIERKHVNSLSGPNRTAAHKRGRRKVWPPQLLPWKQIAAERLVKMRGQIALGETLSRIVRSASTARLCRHAIENISCCDQDCAKRKQHFALGPLVRCLHVPPPIGCRNKPVSLIRPMIS